MYKQSLALAVVVSLATCVYAKDYAFPSPNPPAFKDPADIKQIISFIWDDNAYSGKNGTNYEGNTWLDSSVFASQSWVGGKRIEGDWSPGGNNDLDLNEGDFGMAWAAKAFAGHAVEQTMNYHPKNIYIAGDRVIYQGAIYEAISRTEGALATGSFKALPDDAFLETTDWTTNTKVNTPFAELTGWDRTLCAQKYGAPFLKISDIGNASPIKTNPDGSPITMTFNVISGFFLPIERKISGNMGWKDQVSKFGYYKPNDAFYADGYNTADKHDKIAVAWGREMPLYNVGWDAKTEVGYPEDDSKLIVMGYINQIFQETKALGHEIGNHTIDHMETNSPLPYAVGNPYLGNVEGEAYLDGFARWNGEGFDSTQIDVTPFGDVDEADAFGQKVGNPWQMMGWTSYAGKFISKDAWKGAIKISEEQLDEYLGVSVAKDNCFAFRAPRLEVNSEMFYALSELGYLYDCGLEEGYEYNVDGTNFLWPYTTDNGSPNTSWQRAIGTDVTIDSMPAGLWQYPVSTFLVPEDIRPQVWANHAEITRAEGNSSTPEDSTHWVNKSGKITGFDFNIFILWGMTKDNALATMKYTLDQRLKGGKAPMQVGCHTDYFTPIYDNATLLSDFNKNTFGLSVTRGWNTWRDRIAVWEAFRDYGLSEGAHFWSGKQTIDYVKGLLKEEKYGTIIDTMRTAQWNFFTDENIASNSSVNSAVGNIDNATVTIGAAQEDLYPHAGFSFYKAAGDFSGLSHIALTYKTTAPLVLRLIMANDNPWEVRLNNLNTEVKSGRIPLYAFQYNQYDTTGINTAPNTDDITGIEVQVQTAGKEETHTISLRDLALYTGELCSPIANTGSLAQKQSVALHSMSNTSLKLNLSKAGLYNVDVISINGRIIKAFRNTSLKAGINTLNLNNLATGMYMIRIANPQFKASLKSLVL